MFLLVVFLPLLGFIGSSIFSKFLGSRGSIFVTITCLFITLLFSFVLFYEVGFLGSSCFLNILPWVNCGLFQCSWSFRFDTITVTMLVVVNSISILVHIYSISYMEFDPHLSRFLSYLSFFTFFMIMLVTADNFIHLFFGWEGVGLSSYLLINFWFTRILANKSAIKAMVINRIGDIGLTIGIIIIFNIFKSINFSTVFALSYLYKLDYIYFLGVYWHGLSIGCFFLFIGTIGKSAQLGLHTWLPDAMEGPTPVSALIHAATMVTAGIFLVVRCCYLFEYCPTILTLMSFVGAITAFFGSSVGLVQFDLKKVVAYSTCSQLGYMVFICGLSGYSVGFFHLVNHAFFKALLFLTAGAIIHSLSNEQDLRNMGGLIKFLPFSYIMFFIGSLSLMGMPFLTGFYSKDVILELSYSCYGIGSLFSYWLGVLAAFLTAFYSWRLLYLTFLNRINGVKFYYVLIHESSLLIFLVLFLLGLASIFVGFLLKDSFIGLGTIFWNYSIFILFDNDYLIDSEFIPSLVKLCPVFISFFGGFFSIILYWNGRFYIFNFFFNDLIKLYYFSFRVLFIFLNQKWFFDRIYNQYLANNLLVLSYKISWKLIDKGTLEFFGPLGFSKFLTIGSKKLVSYQTGYISNSLFLFFLSVILFFCLFLCLSNLNLFFYNFDVKIWFFILIIVSSILQFIN